MPPSRDAELEAEIRRLRAQTRRLVDDVNDAEENVRVYRRVLYRLIQRCNACPLCSPPSDDT